MKKKKEYEKEIRKLKSERNFVFLGHEFEGYLEDYPEDAMQLINSTFLSEKAKEKGDFFEKFPNLFLKVAKNYEMNGQYEEAKDLLFELMSRGILQKEVAYRIKLIELKQSLEQGKDGEKQLDDLKDITKGDSEHELPTDKQGEFTDYDFMTSFFEEIPIVELDKEIFPTDMLPPTTTRDHNRGEEPGEKPAYDEALSARKRLEFIKQHFEIEKVMVGESNFTGTILFEVANSDLVIAESFFRKNKRGQSIEEYGKATYILPKDSAIDLVGLSRGELRDKVGVEPKIKNVDHTSKKYYNELIKRFNEAQREDYDKIEQKSDPLAEKKKVKSVKKTNAKTKLKGDMLKNQSGNEEFVSNINEELDGILTPEVQEGFLNRVSYSFEELYKNKLEDKIFDKLDEMGISEQEREKEAKKIFVYIRMMTKISMINSGAINGEELDELLEKAAWEYEKVIDVLEQHKEDGLSYGEVQKLAKEELGIEDKRRGKKEKQDVLNDKDEIKNTIVEETKLKGEAELVSSEDTNADETQESTNIEPVIDEKEDTTPKQSNPLIEKIQSLIQESSELDEKIAEAEKILAQKEMEKVAAEKSYEEAKAKAEALKTQRGEVNDRLSRIEDLLK